MKSTDTTKSGLMFCTLVALVLIGQTLAFHDDKAAAKSKCESATYVNDNPTECYKNEK